MRYTHCLVMGLAVVLGVSNSDGAEPELLSAEQLREHVEQLKSDVFSERFAAYEAILKQGPHAKLVWPELSQLLRSDHDRTRQAALASMLQIGEGGAEAVPLLIELLDHEDFHTRYWSCRVLASIGFPDAEPAVPHLIEALQTGVSSVRRNAAITLGTFGSSVAPRAQPHLLRALADGQATVREQAAIALGRQAGPASDAQVAVALRDSFQDPSPDTRIAAAVAHWQVTGEPAAALDQLLADLQGIDAPLKAAQAFATLGTAAQSAVPRIAEMLESADVEKKMLAATALGEIGPAASAAVPTLNRMQQSDDKEVRLIARDALTKIQDAAPSDVPR